MNLWPQSRPRRENSSRDIMYRICARNNLFGLGPDLWRHICSFTGPDEFDEREDFHDVISDIECTFNGIDIVRFCAIECPGWVRLYSDIVEWENNIAAFIFNYGDFDLAYILDDTTYELQSKLPWHVLSMIMRNVAYKLAAEAFRIR